jgi:hypothetical protein
VKAAWQEAHRHMKLSCPRKRAVFRADEIEPISRGVLDHPLSRMMTVGAAISQMRLRRLFD